MNIFILNCFHSYCLLSDIGFKIVLTQCVLKLTDLPAIQTVGGLCYKYPLYLTSSLCDFINIFYHTFDFIHLLFFWLDSY